MLVKNKIFSYLNDYNLNLDTILVEKKSTIKALKEKIELTEEDFLSMNPEDDETIDHPVIITLSIKQIKKLSKIYHYKYKDLSLMKILTNNNYFHREKISLPLINEKNLQILYKKQDEEIVTYLEIESEELEKELNIIHMNLIKNIFKTKVLEQQSWVKLFLSERCNLHCSYCYEQKREAIIIDINILKKTLTRVVNGSNVNIFGGEPFLHIDLMKELIEWGVEYKNFKFSISTNGQIIDREFLRDYCKNVRIYLSIDGPEHVHDLNRGEGSWKKAMEFYRSFYGETSKYPDAIMTINENCVEHMYDSIRWMHQFELKASRNAKILKRFELSNTSTWDRSFLNELERQLDLIIDWYIKNKIYETNWLLATFREAERQLLENEKNSAITRENACKNRLNLFPNGKILPCYRSPWNDDKYFSVDYKNDQDLIEYYYVVNKYNIEQCRDCEAWGCSPGCVAEFQKTKGNLFKPNENWCDSNKLFIRKSYEYIKKRIGEKYVN